MTAMRAREYFAYARQRPGFRISFAENEQQFIEGVELALANAIASIESLAPVLPETQVREEFFSGVLCKLIDAMEIDVVNDGYHGGHVDFMIRHPVRKALVALGECKVWAGYEWHVKGCAQLLERYLTGRQKRGFCVEFFGVENMYILLRGLSEDLAGKMPLRQTEGPRSHAPIAGAFITCHLHSSGATVEICHAGCNVHHLHPRKGRSGRKKIPSGSESG
jgi:hypothetical protein